MEQPASLPVLIDPPQPVPEKRVPAGARDLDGDPDDVKRNSPGVDVRAVHRRPPLPDDCRERLALRCDESVDLSVGPGRERNSWSSPGGVVIFVRAVRVVVFVPTLHRAVVIVAVAQLDAN